MNALQLDATLRIAGVTALLLAAAHLVRTPGQARAALWFAPMAVCLCGFLIGNTAEPALQVSGALAQVAHLLSGYAVVFVWWFCLAAFDPDFSPRGGVLAAGLAWLVIAGVDRGLLGPALQDVGLSYALILLGLGMISHLVWELIRSRSGDLLQRRRDARIVIVIALAALLASDFAKDLLLGIGSRPAAYTVAQSATLLVLAIAVLLSPGVPARRAGGALTTTAPSTPVPATIEARVLARLHSLIEVERVHLDAGLTFEDFARRLGAPERAVRRLINHELGYDHFRTFVNVHRVAEARRLLSDPAHQGDKLIAVATDSGFASLASFNRAFRAVEGCTPSEFRARRARPDPGTASHAGSEEPSTAF